MEASETRYSYTSNKFSLGQIHTKGGDDYWSPIHDTLMRNGNDPTYVRKSDEVINTYELY